MAERKKRGLGRGLGALIPDANSSDRPVDVFFSGGDSEQSGKESEAEAKSPRAARNDPAASMQSSRRRKPKTGAAAKSAETKEAGSKAAATTTSGAKASGSKTSGSKSSGAKTSGSKTSASTTSGSKASNTSSTEPSSSATSAKRAGSTATQSATKRAATKSTGSAKTAAGAKSTAGAGAKAAGGARGKSTGGAGTSSSTKVAGSKSASESTGAPKSNSTSTTSNRTTTAKTGAATEASPTAKSAGTAGGTASKASTQSQTKSNDAQKSAAGEATASANTAVPETSEDVRETHPGVYTSSGAATPEESWAAGNETVSGTTDVVASVSEVSDSSESAVAEERSSQSSPSGSDHDGPIATDTSGEIVDEETSEQNATGDLDGVESIPDTEFGEIDVELIDANPRQPRTVFDEDMLAELVHSIREIGVLQPVVVRQKPSDPGRFELIMGERRLRATKDAGLSTIPAIIRYVEDTDLLRDALLENLHRAELNPLEEAAAYGQLLEDFGCTQEELSERIGRSRPQISNTLRLLRLPPLVQRRVAAGVISAGHARAILGLRDAEHMEVLAQRIVAEGLSVRASEEAVVLLNRGDSVNVSRATSKVSPEFIAVAERLGDRLDTKVNITVGKRKGKLSVEFANQEDLDRILTLLGISQAEQ